jgi:hypothetical protein
MVPPAWTKIRQIHCHGNTMSRRDKRPVKKNENMKGSVPYGTAENQSDLIYQPDVPDGT